MTAPNYGERLRLAREKAGLTQDELGAALNKTGSSIRDWERNKVRWWRKPQLVEAVAKAVNTNPDALIGFDAEPVEHPQGQPIGENLAELLLDLLMDPKANENHKKAARATLEEALGIHRRASA